MTQLSPEWSTIAGWIRELAEAGMPAEEIYNHIKGPDGTDLAQGAVERALRNVNLFSKRTPRLSKRMTPEEARVPTGFQSLGNALDETTRNVLKANTRPGEGDAPRGRSGW